MWTFPVSFWGTSHNSKQQTILWVILIFAYFTIVLLQNMTLLWLPKHRSINSWVVSKSCFFSPSLTPNFSDLYRSVTVKWRFIDFWNAWITFSLAKDPHEAACTSYKWFWIKQRFPLHPEENQLLLGNTTELREVKWKIAKDYTYLVQWVHTSTKYIQELDGSSHASSVDNPLPLSRGARSYPPGPHSFVMQICHNRD